MLLFFAMTSFAQDCVSRPSNDGVRAVIVAAEKAFYKGDTLVMQSAVAEARVVIDCAGEVIDSKLAARAHRLEGMLAFVDEREQQGKKAFAAARLSNSDFQWPDSVDEDNAIRELYLAFDSSGESEKIKTPKGWVSVIDGVETTRRPLSVPAILQMHVGGEVQNSEYLWPKDPLPEWGTNGASGRKKLLIPGIATAATGAVLLGVGLASGPNAEMDLGQAVGASRRNDVFTGIGAGLLATGGGLIGVSFTK